MGYYWIPYFVDYIKKRNLIDAKVYENNNDIILVLPTNNDYPLRSNIFRIKNNIAYQFYNISSDKITINNQIYTLKLTEFNLQLNNDTYVKIDYDLNLLMYIPIPHTIKIKNYKELNNKYEIELYSDVYNEYAKNIPLIYVNRDELVIENLSIYENIYRYLEKNKYIGIVK